MDVITTDDVASVVPDQQRGDVVVKEAQVQEVLGRLARGEAVQAIARALGLDPKTVRAWRARGTWRPRVVRPRRSILDPFAEWLRARAPEVEYNGVVLLRELREQGYRGGLNQVHRFVRPLRVAARQACRATGRFETPPGQQAQVDFGQRLLWIGDTLVKAQLFVFTLGYCRRLYATAFPHARLDAVLAGHEQAFQHFGGVPLQIVVDNAKPTVLEHTREHVVFHPVYADFAAHYGFTPWAHWPYRPQTKGKVESNIGYVKHNALAGKRFGSWTHVNAWLLEWCTQVADLRVHGTTHEVPLARFATEHLTPLGSRPPYQRERVRVRIVPPDALVAISAARYSVPIRYVGAQVRVRETTQGFEILHDDQVIARHARAERHQVIMEPAHYAGLLRADRAEAVPVPRFDPRYPVAGDVLVRDLAVYAALVEDGAAA
ncbi:MAG: IS21 family transposase [Pseudonocardia sp.]|nr:IS21 family transposase [Pseudonocardia sp.]